LGQEPDLFCTVLLIRAKERWDFFLVLLLSHDELGVRLHPKYRQSLEELFNNRSGRVMSLLMLDRPIRLGYSWENLGL
jgi:hypothetical protein